jgi:hypothetical protein
MDELLDRQTPTNLIYKDKAIWFGTFLGGPLAAGYLIAENFKAFNDFDKAKKTWIYAIIITIVVIGGALLIPDSVNIPNYIIPLAYTSFAYYIVQHFQGHNIAKHINAGGQLHSWWRTIVVGIIGLAITLIPIIGYVLLTEGNENASISTKSYGIMGHEIAFDKNNISENEVNLIADGLTQTTFFDEAIKKFVYLKKINENYELSFSVVEGIENDDPSLQPFIDLRADLQTLFPNNKIVFKLVVDSFDNVVKTIE